MISKRLLAIAALSIAAIAPIEARASSTGSFVIPAGSNRFQIATQVEANWNLDALFDCVIVSGSFVKATGTMAPCLGEVRYFEFVPQTADGTTSAPITFDLQITCSGGGAEGHTATLSLNGSALPVPPGCSTRTPGPMNVLAVNNLGSLSAGPVGGGVWMALLALLFLTAGVVFVRRNASLA